MVDDFNKEMCDREHAHLAGELKRIESDMKEDVTALKKVVDKIRDRLPTWATLLLMALTAALGYTLKH